MFKLYIGRETRFLTHCTYKMQESAAHYTKITEFNRRNVCGVCDNAYERYVCIMYINLNIRCTSQ